MKSVNIYNVRLNGNTHNFCGLEWIIDGEDGRRNYPGTWAECTAREFYRNGRNYNDPRQFNRLFCKDKAKN